MEARNFSFDELPKIVYQLSEQIKELKELVKDKEPQDAGNDLISRKEAMALLGITDPTLWTWAKQGRLRTYKIGNRVYLKRSELAEAINQNITKK